MDQFQSTALLVFTTERLLLRPLLPDDAKGILHIRSNDIVNRYIDRPKANTIEDAKEFLTRIENLTNNKGCYYWAIFLKETQELIGTICYFNFDNERRMAEIGYELLPDHQRKGIMLEAISTVINFGFETLNLSVIYALVKPDNERSVLQLLKNNFSKDINFEYINKEKSGNFNAYILTYDNYTKAKAS
ncbi:GNAT family N-acetyltransferase [Ferruginibacter lapsinanis]|uniref:GNAT family N-acetyltransferase n=1 Tax=Ferruginibacter lapsinanis TaxID=563172 RepID=UPI001E61F3DA|nr:GNAT family N-acetyltransferase [Ferruginibacter lapsinanis]UEG49164.1 GNAT family N-acetyltransferase [Ferruginibacter lapsinanis]